MNYPIDASSYHVRGYMLHGCQKAKAALKQAKSTWSVAETKRNTGKDTAPQVSCPTDHCRGRLFRHAPVARPLKSAPLWRKQSLWLVAQARKVKARSPSLLVPLRATERDPLSQDTLSCRWLVKSGQLEPVNWKLCPLCEDGWRGWAARKSWCSSWSLDDRRGIVCALGGTPTQASNSPAKHRDGPAVRNYMLP